jgi:hypothetical protein
MLRLATLAGAAIAALGSSFGMEAWKIQRPHAAVSMCSTAGKEVDGALIAGPRLFPHFLAISSNFIIYIV